MAWGVGVKWGWGPGGTSPGLLPRPGSALRRRTGGAWQCPRICRETGHAESAANGVLGGQEELVQGPADPGKGQPTRDRPTSAPLAQMGWGSIEAALSCAAVSVPASPPLPPSTGGRTVSRRMPACFSPLPLGMLRRGRRTQPFSTFMKLD